MENNNTPVMYTEEQLMARLKFFIGICLSLTLFGIVFVVLYSLIFVTQPLKNKPDTFFAPIVFLSVLTLSVAVMAFLFFYQPLQLFIDGKQKEAVNLFVKTVGVFAFITAVTLTLIFSRLI